MMKDAMQYMPLTSCGEVRFEFSKKDRDGTIVSREFVKKLIDNIVRRSVYYFDKIEDYMFRHKERSMHSIVCPASLYDER